MRKGYTSHSVLILIQLFLYAGLGWGQESQPELLFGPTPPPDKFPNIFQTPQAPIKRAIAGPERLSLYHKVSIPIKCEQSYTLGTKFFAKAVEDSFKVRNTYAFYLSRSEQQELMKFKRMVAYENKWKELLEKDKALPPEKRIYPIDCRLYFDIGVYDALGLSQQNTIIEYLLETDHNHRLYRKNYRYKRIKEMTDRDFKQRLFKLEVTDEAIANMDYGTKFFNTILPKVKSEFLRIAKEENDEKPITFGRFIFIPSKRDYYSIYEYKLWRPRGVLVRKREVRGHDYEKVAGSWQYQVQKLVNEAIGMATEYIKWNPSTWFGDDALVAGVLSEYNPLEWLKDDSKDLGHWDNVRMVKEKWYFDMITYYRNQAKNRLFAPHSMLKPFDDISNVMAEKQSATFDRDIKVAEKIGFGAFMAIPLVLSMPLAGYGALMLFGEEVTLGFTLAGAGLRTVQLGTQAMHTVGAAITATGMILAAGWGAKNLYKNVKGKKVDFTPAVAMDHILTSVVGAFPLICLSNISLAIPQTRGFWAAGKDVLTGLLGGARTAYNLGFMGSMAQLPGLTYSLLVEKFLVQGILTLNFWKLWAINLTSWTAFSAVVKEVRIDDRQPWYSLERWWGHRGEHPWGWNPFFARNEDGTRRLLDFWGYDKETLITLASVAALELAFVRVYAVKGLETRFVWNRIISLVGFPVVGVAVANKLGNDYSEDRLWIDVGSSASCGALTSEIYRYLSTKTTFQGGKGSVYLWLIRFGLIAANAVFKEALISHYLNGTEITLEDFSEKLKENFGFNMDFLKADEFEHALKEFRRDLHNLEIIKFLKTAEPMLNIPDHPLLREPEQDLDEDEGLWEDDYWDMDNDPLNGF